MNEQTKEQETFSPYYYSEWGEVARNYIEEVHSDYKERMMLLGGVESVIDNAAQIGADTAVDELKRPTQEYIAKELGRDAIFKYIDGLVEQDEIELKINKE